MVHVRRQQLTLIDSDFNEFIQLGMRTVKRDFLRVHFQSDNTEIYFGSLRFREKLWWLIYGRWRSWWKRQVRYGKNETSCFALKKNKDQSTKWQPGFKRPRPSLELTRARYEMGDVRLGILSKKNSGTRRDFDGCSISVPNSSSMHMRCGMHDKHQDILVYVLPPDNQAGHTAVYEALNYEVL